MNIFIWKHVIYGDLFFEVCGLPEKLMPVIEDEILDPIIIGLGANANKDLQRREHVDKSGTRKTSPLTCYLL